MANTENYSVHRRTDIWLRFLHERDIIMIDTGECVSVDCGYEAKNILAPCEYRITMLVESDEIVKLLQNTEHTEHTHQHSCGRLRFLTVCSGSGGPYCWGWRMLGRTHIHQHQRQLGSRWTSTSNSEIYLFCSISNFCCLHINYLVSLVSQQ
jgi:hypothetical protein